MKGLTVTTLFMVLLPGGAAVLALLLPESLGIFIPIAAIVYLTLMAFVLSIPWRKANSTR